jgi:hypothetical protein
VPIRGPRSTQPPSARAPANAEPAAAPLVANRPALPVTRTDAPLNADLSVIGVHGEARPKGTLDLDEILQAPPERQSTLLWRFVGAAALRAGHALGTTLCALPSRLDVQRPGTRLSTDDARHVKITLDGETRTIDSTAPSSADALFALRAFDRALIKDGAIDRDVATLFLPLFGPDGAFVRSGAKPLDAGERFARPKLICWDFNGTVERFGDGRTRADLPVSAAALRRRGAMSVLTTSMGPAPGEKFLEDAGVSFVSHYGRKEVRPTRGNKEYTGVARAHGVDVADAKHVMAVFGDSATDIPHDLPGVVFFHNSADTPAPVAERLLAAIDAAGHGSLHDGLEGLLGGYPAVGGVKRALVGPISFAVEMRDGGSPQSPCLVPTVHDVRVAYSSAELVAALKSAPTPEKLNARAAYRGALEHLADALDAGQVPEVLRSLRGTPGDAAARAAVERRVAWHGVEVERAQKFVGGADAWAERALSGDDVVRTLRALVATGDPQVAAQLPALAKHVVDVADAAERKLVASVDAHAKALRENVEKARVSAMPFVPGAAVPDKKLQAALHRIARNPVPFSAEAQAKQLEALVALRTTPLVGSGPLLDKILESLTEALPDEKKLIAERFDDRRAKAAEILASVKDAGAVATTTAGHYTAIEAQLRAS